VLIQVTKEQEPLIILEKKSMEIDHQEVGEMIASKWKLNAVITDAICHHHSPEFAQPENQALVATVALADFYVCLFDIGYAGNRYPDDSRLASLLDMCGLEWSAVMGLTEALTKKSKRRRSFSRFD
jgi:HD-like signal output (HDOD) protein